MATLSSLPAQAAVEFTAQEIQTHKDKIQIVIDTATECLDDTYKSHLDFYAKHGVSKYYGNRRKQHQTRAGLIAELKRFGKPASLVDQLEPMSCIGLTIKCLKAGFVKADQADTWAKIHKALAVNNAFGGTDLQIMLRQLGWKVIYWNPNPAKNAAWDEDDRRLTPLAAGRTWMPVWGGHAYRYAGVKNKNMYYTVPVDDKTTLVGFEDRPPPSFANIPLFIGTAHAGYHVFPGRLGDVIEAHSMRELNAKDNLEYSRFNPLGSGGGPRWTRTEKYRSGVIAVPPGY